MSLLLGAMSPLTVTPCCQLVPRESSPADALLLHSVHELEEVLSPINGNISWRYQWSGIFAMLRATLIAPVVIVSVLCLSPVSFVIVFYLIGI